MNALLKKLNFKNEDMIHILNSPAEFKDYIKEISMLTTVCFDVKEGKIEFIIVFVKSKEDIFNFSEKYESELQGDCTLWMAYPKKSSKRYKSEISRDDGWQPMGNLGFEGVRIISIDENWTALRLRNAVYIKSMKRNSNWAMSELGRIKSGKNDK